MTLESLPRPKPDLRLVDSRSEAERRRRAEVAHYTAEGIRAREMAKIAPTGRKRDAYTAFAAHAEMMAGEVGK